METPGEAAAAADRKLVGPLMRAAFELEELFLLNRPDMPRTVFPADPGRPVFPEMTIELKKELDFHWKWQGGLTAAIAGQKGRLMAGESSIGSSQQPGDGEVGAKE